MGAPVGPLEAEPMKPIQLIITPGREPLTSQADLGLVGALLGRTALGTRLDPVPVAKRPLPGLRHGDVVTTRSAGWAWASPTATSSSHLSRYTHFRAVSVHPVARSDDAGLVPVWGPAGGRLGSKRPPTA